jgi:hypothetical protein
MTGTPNQIEWAGRVKSSVAAEFDRVTGALTTVANRHTGRDLLDDRTAIEILRKTRFDRQDVSNLEREIIAPYPRAAVRAARRTPESQP